MKPHFQDGLITIYQGDSTKIVPILKNKIDAIITDPPYGIGFASGKPGDSYKKKSGTTGRLANPSKFAGRKILGDDQPFDPKYLLDLKVDKMCLWGANNYASKLPDSYGWLVWDKLNGITPVDFSDCELAWTTNKGALRMKRLYWYGALKQTERNETRIHPTQKPISLMSWCIDRLKVEKGETVLDPYMGSGSLGIACLLKGINYIGIELDPEFLESGTNRIKRRLKKFKHGFGITN